MKPGFFLFPCIEMIFEPKKLKSYKLRPPRCDCQKNLGENPLLDQKSNLKQPDFGNIDQFLNY